MRKLTGMLLTAALVMGSFSSFGQGVSAAAQKTIVPDATAKIQLVQTPEQVQVDDRKLIVEANVKELPLLENAMHVVSLPIRMENGKGEAMDLLQEDLTFTSSNESVFTIEEHVLSGKKVGTADLIIGFQGKETRIQMQVTTNFVGLQFEDERAEEFSAFYARYYNAAEKAFDYMEIMMSYDERSGAQKIYGIDWSKPGPYYVDFMVDNAMYTVEITAADKNKTKTISADLVEVTLDTGDFPISQVHPQFMKQGVPAVDGGFMGPAFYYGLTPGDYVLNVSAVSETDFYMASTPVQKIEAGKQLVPVSFDATVPMKVSPTLKKGTFLSSMYVCSVFCEELTGDFEQLHFPKGSDVSVSPVIEKDSLFYQFDYKFDKMNGARDLKIDAQVKTSLAFGNQVYKGGSELFLGDVLSVKNNAGSDLMFIYDEAFNFYGGMLTFENVADASETYVYNLNHFTLETIELPNTTGIFNVTFSFGMIDADAKPGFVDLEDDWYHWSDTTTTVPTDYTWTIRYNAPVLEHTVRLDAIFVTDGDGNVVRDAHVSVEGDAIYVYAPEFGYAEGETYYLCIRNTVQNIAGKSMKHNIKMDFVASDVAE